MHYIEVARCSDEIPIWIVSLFYTYDNEIEDFLLVSHKNRTISLLVSRQYVNKMNHFYPMLWEKQNLFSSLDFSEEFPITQYFSGKLTLTLRVFTHRMKAQVYPRV